MAKRPIFLPQLEGGIYVKTEEVEFEWFPGFAVSQKQKSINALHGEINKKFSIAKALEISSKSPDKLGVDLSAFNLSFTTKKQRKITVECAFQGSKVFQKGGPYNDIFESTSLDAKRDERLKNSGALIGFKFFNESWPSEPKTAFYDWLYMNALRKNEDAMAEILQYQAFTDIEFNPKKSINCQAYAAALFVALSKREELEVINSKEDFLSFLKKTVVQNAYEDQSKQKTLL